MWCHLPTGIGRLRALRFVALISLIVALTTTLIISQIAQATTGINKTINFQGRLLTSSGATVPDGYYNIQFKIYQDGTGTAAGNPGGTLKWTEDYINNGGTSGVVVKNGFLSVNLGSITAFGTSVDWNQDTLWLSMNVAGTATACTTYGTAPCTADGEMLPMKRMTATPYSLNSGALNGLTATNFVQLAQGVQTDASTNSSIYINKTNTGNLVQLQSSGTDVLNVSGSGNLLFGNNGNHSINVATAAASTAGWQMYMVAGAGGSGTGSNGGDLTLQGGNAGGTNANGGAVQIDAGAKTGSGTDGYISIGTTTARTIFLGSTYLGINQDIYVGNNDTAGSTSNVYIGAGSNAAGGSTAIRSKANTTIATNGTTRATFDTSGSLFLGDGITSSSTGTFRIQGSTGATNQTGYTLNLLAGNGGSGASANAGGNLNLSSGDGGGTNGVAGNITIDTGTPNGTGAQGYVAIGTSNSDGVTIGNMNAATGTVMQGGTGGSAIVIKSGVGGTINVGSNNTANTIQIGSSTLSSGTQTINVGNNNTAGGTTNVTIGAGSTATGGTTAIQSKGNTTISTNGTTRATFDTSGTLFLGDGTTSSSTGTFRIQGSTGATNNAGYTFNILAGAGGNGASANAGGDINLKSGAGGGTNGAGGNVIIDTGTPNGTGAQGYVAIGTGNSDGITVGNMNAATGTVMQGGTGSSAIVIRSGVGGTINVGSSNTANTIQIGSSTLSIGTQTINIGNNSTAGGITNLTIGSTNTTSATTIRSGSGNINLNGAVVANSTIDAVSGYKFNGTAGATTTCSSGQYLQQQVVQGGITTSGTCTTVTATTTLQQAYDNSGATPTIGLGSTGNGILIRDNAAPISGNLFAIQNSAGSTNYLAVSTSGASVAGTFSATGTINNATISGGTLSGGTYSATGATFGTGASTIGLTQAAASTAGGNLTIQAGQSGTGAVNGGDVIVQGGTSGGSGTQGLVKLSTTAFTTATNQSFGANGGVTQANVDNNSAIQISSTVAGPITVTIPAPTNSTTGRLLYVTVTGSNSIIISPSGGTNMTLSPNTTATLIWNVAGTSWTNAGFDGGSNSYIQNQTASTQTAGFKINGTGTANNFVGSGLDTATAGALSLGTTTANAVNIGNSTTATTTTILGGVNGTTPTVSIQGAANAYLAIGTTNVNTVQIGAVGATANASTVQIGTSSGAAQTLTAGSTASTSTTTIQGGVNGTTPTVSVQAATNGYIAIGTTNANTLQLGAVGATANNSSVNIANSTAGIQTVGIGSLNSTSATTIQGGTSATAVNIQSGAAGTINVGTNNTANTVQIGSTTLSAGTQTINIGNNNTAGGTTNVTVGTGSTAAGGSTAIQSKGNTTLATNGTTRATLDTSGKLYLGDGITSASTGTFTIQGSTGAASNTGYALTMQGGTGGSGTGFTGGNLYLQGGTGGGTNGNGGTTSIQAGVKTGTGTDGNIVIGDTNASAIIIGSTYLGLTQTINIGNNNTAGNNTNVYIGAGSSSASGLTAIQSKNETTFTTNGTARALLSGTSNTLYVGNANSSGQAATANAFTIQGTSSTTANVQGGALTLQSGAATAGNANGGNLNLTAGAGFGTGVNGLVVFNTPTFQTSASDANCYTGGANVAGSCTLTSASVNGSAAIIAGFSTTGQTATLPDPAISTAGRVIYITASATTEDFTLRANAGGGVGIEQNIAMRKNTTATMIWNGADWTAAGASSSTTLQAAYDNTLTSAGGAELLVSNGANANGLTIRDSAANPVNGTLLEVQNSAAATLFAVNGTVTEYASNAGVESGVSASDWSAAPVAATVTRNTTTGFVATGQGSASVVTSTTALSGIKNQLSTALTPNQHYNASFTTKLASGTFTDMEVYYSNQGTNSSVLCTSGQAVKTSVWTKVNCAFTASASGITSANAIIIRQTGGGTARTFYVDNLSVTIAADYNYATDGTVNDSVNFATNWNTAGLGTVAVTRNTSDGQQASDSAQAAISAGAANAGVRNKLSINPLSSTLYRVSVYAKQSSGAAFTDFKVRYSRDGGTNYIDCADYNTQTVTTGAWTQITCYITTDGSAPSNPYVYFVEGSSAVRTYGVDSFSMTLASSSTPNVQIGGGVNGGPTTLFTLDKGASAPIAANNDALLGSMYYDTTLGKLQCYEADGWGACGSSPDNIVTISPEYNNAVMHGTGVGTMVSDLCSDTLNINDGSSGQPTICGANETYNFYKWTSPQATSQTYGIYVTYQLPTTFKEFTSGSTSLMGRTDSANSSVTFQIYRSNSSGLTACGSAVSVSTGVQTTWQTAIVSGAADPSTCGFTSGDSVVFKININANSNANAYVGNLGFTYSNN